ncbi:monocarboxylate transporter 12-B [Chelonus insularis]|uniref:monocarboxylate transporter 12-B n=1 Tax=Chelonus insularis TaxID=460826 RepID=UPI00158993D5|nr:monocarboxylate transporter 12-B [Chelonus insularis]
MSLPREWNFLPQEARSSMDLRHPSDEVSKNFNGSITSAVIDENLNQKDLLGSLFSIHSAPVYDLNTSSPTRPSASLVAANATSTPVVPPHLSPDIDDEDNDNLLTISSLTARPLIATAREIRSSKKSAIRKKSNKETKRRKKNTNLVPLDGGYGWIIVGGAFFVQFWVAGLVKSYGVLYVEIMETFQDSSASFASWIPAILSCLCLALAPVTSILCQKYSCRLVVFIGGLFCALGLTLSYFATRLIHLFFTFGVMTGIGGGLSTTPGIIIVSQYFNKHRALANGICVSGTAAGSFVFPLLIEFLVANFGFHGTILLLGGCMLNVCVSASLYRPLEDNPSAVIESKEIETKEDSIVEAPPLKQQKLELIFANDKTPEKNILNDFFIQNTTVDLTDSEEEKDIMGEGLRMKPISKIRSSSILHSVEDLSTDSTCVYKARSSLKSLRPSTTTLACPPFSKEPVVTKTKSEHVTLSQKIMEYLDISLLKNVQFLMMCLSVMLMSTGSPYMLYYLPAYVHDSGYTKSEAGYLVAISAAFDLFGRLGLGWLSDLQLFNRRKGYIGSIVGAGVAVLAIPMAHSFYVLACSVGMYGLCLGCWFLLVPVLLADQYGTEKISSTYGLVRMFQSVGAISIPPLAGYLRDRTGSYNTCFFCMGTCMMLGGLPLLFVSSDMQRNKRNELNVNVPLNGQITQVKPQE